MRPPSESTSVLYHPLETILGTPASLRIVRALCLHGGALATTDLAERVGLSRQGVLVAIKRLLGTGILEEVGSGRSVSYRINRSYPLAASLVALFESEAGLIDGVFNEIREFARAQGEDLVAIWLYGSVARHEDRPESDLDIMVVSADGESIETVEDLNERLSTFWTWEVYPSVTSLSVEDARRLAEERPSAWDRITQDAVVLYGASPGEVAGG